MGTRGPFWSPNERCLPAKGSSVFVSSTLIDMQLERELLVPMFGYSDTWQLVINTGTSVVTFLMVFLIQSTQNRDGAAIQAKLDELIRASGAQNAFIGIEHVPRRKSTNSGICALVEPPQPMPATRRSFKPTRKPKRPPTRRFSRRTCRVGL